MLFIPFSGSTLLTKEALLLFVGSDTPGWIEIKDNFKEWAEANVVPPEIFVLACVESAKALCESAAKEPDSQSALEVMRKLSNVRLFEYTGDGHVAHVEKEDAKRLVVDGVADLLGPAVNSLIATQMTAGNVVTPAPQGFYFSKLSDRYSSHFIRAEGLLSCSDSIELLALRLLKPFRDYCDTLADGRVRILIDSMVIWPLAQALVSMRRSKDPARRFVIQSFRSYEGLEDDGIQSGPAFVIISASTSGGLARRLLDKIGPGHIKFLTVLGLEPAESQSGAVGTGKGVEDYLFVVPRQLSGAPSLEGLRAQFATDIAALPPGNESVRIFGERFFNQNFRPRPVRLAHAALKDQRKERLAQIASDRLALAARRRLDTKSYWSVSFDIAALVDRYCVDNPSGECRMRSWLTNYAVPGDAAVVYPVDTLEKGRKDEGQARRMAEIVQDMLQKRSPSASIRVLNSAELDAPATELFQFMRQAGVVVVAPVVGNGFILKQISAALRSVQPKGPRLYIALAALPESQARLKELGDDLQSNADERAYHFKHAFALPIGKLDQNIDWLRELQLMDSIVDVCAERGIDVPARLHNRLIGIRAGDGLSGELTFLPSFAGNALAMSPGFLLWKIGTPIAGDDLGASVLMTVAAFLEACRSAETKNSETSLVSGLFQQTLIAPANFTRFNDPAIQAALLRSAYRSELNFSSCPDMSSDMQRLVLRLIRLHDAPAGEALPEFLLALAMGRLTLHRDHMEELLAAAAKLPGWLAVLAEEIRH